MRLILGGETCETQNAGCCGLWPERPSTPATGSPELTKITSYVGLSWKKLELRAFLGTVVKMTEMTSVCIMGG
jgi:hypothetical protein